ncbi:hypothetical protein Pyn_05764 [Prunus yedoensis var. nudiflora]|uniref:Uncharacterized protein n=1 Tax=Prunus yedoensis var. nudiflora TaxID=2094558 RepID=A0A314ZIV2_PRUYE|nr:hypothetical protein Pyn_05764 [Prunus yedoensis var. nudiflora]
MRLADVNQGITVIDMRIPLPGLFGSEVERVFLVVILYEMASLIAEGHELGKADPVVYVSSEKLIRYLVFIDVPLQVCEARQAKGYICLHVQGRSKWYLNGRRKDTYTQMELEVREELATHVLEWLFD